MRVDFGTPDILKLRGEYMLVDMHFHSRYSHDSSTNIASIIETCRNMGVHVALTDHNSIKGVLMAEKIAPGVIKPGIEITTREGKDVLVYFYTVEDLQRFFTSVVERHVRITSSLRGTRTRLSTQELLDELEHWRCLTALAHPFAIGARRSYKFFRNGNGSTQRVDAIEVINESLHHKGNLAAVGLATQYKKAFICGSDGHILAMLGTAFTVSKASSWEEFLDNIKKQDVSVIGEERKLRHHVLNMSLILREKARVIENRRIKREQL